MATSVSPPAPFWTAQATPPAASVWLKWKISFLDYIYLLSDINPSTSLSEPAKLRLLRHNLGEEGQNYFDALNLRAKSSLEDALATLDRSWGIRTNVFTARFKFMHMRQEQGEPLDGFITRLIQEVKSCDYNSIPQKKFESVMLTQQLLVGLRDNRVRECLLSEDSAKLTWERSCDLARARIDVHEQTKLFGDYHNNGEVDKLMHRPTNDSTKRNIRRCYRCGSITHCADSLNCPARSARCYNCGKSGHFALNCRLRAPKISEISLNDTDDNDPPTTGNIFSLNSDCYSTLPIFNFTSEPKLPRSDMRTVFFRTSEGEIALPMELDSASPITIVPKQFYDRYLSDFPIHPSSYTFGTYTHNTVTILGFIMVQLRISSVCEKVAVYVTVNDYKPLLGRNAMVSMGITPSIDRMSIAAIDQSRLANHYPTLFRKDIGRIPFGEHRIRLKNSAVPTSIAQPRPIPLAKRETVSQALTEMLNQDIIERIDCSEWIHPMVTVMRKDGRVRICNDLQALNRQIVVEKFILPSADELIVNLSGAKFFSKLDLTNAFFHMPLTTDSRPLTAFLTTEGLFQYKVLPMGLSSAPAAWQKFMVHALAGIKGQVVYIDDICVYGASREEHDSRLHAVLRRLNDLNLRLNISKCIFCVSEIEFLGHVISASGIRPNTSNIRAIKEAPEPSNVHQVQHFLGLCAYYLRYLPDFVSTAEPLRKLTRKNERFEWKAEQQEAFERIRNQIASAPLMAIFNVDCPTFVSTDASDCGVGAVLSQIQDGVEKVVAYASRKLSVSEKKYSAGEKEALACVWACEKWHLYLFGRPFTLRTDHSALTTLLSRGNKGIRPLRISRWYARLLNYNFIIVYRPGSQNQVADVLSRLPVDDPDDTEARDEQQLISSVTEHFPSAVSRSKLKEATLEDELLQKVQRFLVNGWPKNNKVENALVSFFAIRDELSVIDGCLMRGKRIIPPCRMIPSVIDCAHHGHPGIHRTKVRAQEWFWWPRMSSSIETAVRNCPVCQRADKSAKPLLAPTIPITYPMRPWSKIALDIMGPFSCAPSNQKNMLVATCFYSKWPEAYLTGEVTSTIIIRWLKHMFARFGLPEEIVTDNGPQFTSYQFIQFLKNSDIKHTRTVPYNPSANGMVERLNRSLKESVQAITISGEKWEEAVLIALHTYRTTQHRATEKTPAEMMLGRPLRTLLSAAHQFQQSTDQKEWTKRDAYQSKYLKAGGTLKVNDYVRVRSDEVPKGECVLSSPRKIVRVCGRGTFLLDNGKKVNARRCYSSCAPTPITNGLHSPTVDLPPPNHPLPRRSNRHVRPVDRYIQLCRRG